jgi:hypothetical protein
MNWFPPQVCLAAAQLGNKNRRRNTSLMVRYLAPDGRRLNILIDAGKYDSTFLGPHPWRVLKWESFCSFNFASLRFGIAGFWFFFGFLQRRRIDDMLPFFRMPDSSITVRYNGFHIMGKVPFMISMYVSFELNVNWCF